LLSLFQSQTTGPTTSFFRSERTSVVHENLPHQLCSDRKKVSAILPLGKILMNQSHVGFVNQSSALQGMLLALVPQIVLSDTSEFVVNKGDERIESLTISVSPSAQQNRDLCRWLSLHRAGPILRRERSISGAQISVNE
jgi:hypothetical protein